MTACPARFLFAVGLSVSFASATARADDEASNIVYVKSGTWGRCYAKAVPHKPYGPGGTTRVYLVERGDDKLVHTLPFYNQRIFLQGNMVGPRGRMDGSGISLVRLGAWSRRSKPSAKELAIAFYYNGKLLKEYSTLDIAGKGGAHDRSVSHITVIKEVKGYRSVKGNTYAFDLVTVDGRTLSFNPVTGERM